MTEGAAQLHAALLWTARLQGGGPQISSGKDGDGEDTAIGEAGLKGEKKQTPKIKEGVPPEEAGWSRGA